MHSPLKFQASLFKRDFYTAGVVEFKPSNELSDNLAGYLEIIQSQNATFTDIIVFPESTLNSADSTTFVPNPEDQINPCFSDPNATYYEEFLVTLSCAARNASKYIVINLTEKQKCEDIPEDTRSCASNKIFSIGNCRNRCRSYKETKKFFGKLQRLLEG